MKNFISRNGRELKQGQLVGVHWNSHKNIWSIVEFKTRKTVGLVLGYAEQVTLKNCTVKIDESKKRKALEKGQKDRHAFIVGEIVNCGKSEKLENSLYYKPSCLKSFVDAEEYFTLNRIDYVERMTAVNLDFDFDQNKPVVTYN